jgi:hypothetical protein
MIKWLVNTSDTDEKQMCEVNRNLMITSGVDKVKFVNPSLGVAGNAGLPIRKEYYNAPSIVLKPVSTYLSNPNTGEFMSGTLTQYSDPKSPSAALKSLKWDLPTEGDQVVPSPDLVFAAGIVTSSSPTAIQDGTKSWNVDTWIGYECINVANGLRATITANDANTLTLDADIEAVTDDGYHIVKPQVTGYLLYAAEMNSAEEVIGAQFVLQATIDLETETQFELTSFTSTGLTATDLKPRTTR